MATISDWNKEISQLSNSQLNELSDNLKKLENWDFFKKAYEELGVFTIKHLIDLEIKMRVQNDEEVKKLKLIPYNKEGNFYAWNKYLIVIPMSNDGTPCYESSTIVEHSPACYKDTHIEVLKKFGLNEIEIKEYLNSNIDYHED